MFKPQLRTVGPKYGKLLGGIKNALAALDGNAAMDDLNEKGVLVLNVDGSAVELTREDLLIDTAKKEGYVTQEDSRMTVVLNTNLTEELIEAGFEVMDHIRVSLNENGKLSALAQKNRDAVCGKVLAEELTEGADFKVSKVWDDVNGEKVRITIEKV